MSEKILVTGATGNVGREVVKSLLAMGQPAAMDKTDAQRVPGKETETACFAFGKVDISEPRRLIAEHRRRTTERLSLTAYVVACLSGTFDEFPHFNAFRKGGQLIRIHHAGQSSISTLCMTNWVSRIGPRLRRRPTR